MSTMLYATLLFLTLSIAAIATASAAQYIVKFKDDASFQNFTISQDAAAEANVLNVIKPIAASVVNFSSTEAADKWAASREDVVYVEKDYIWNASSEQTPYGIDLVKALEIQDDYQPDSNIKVCIIDSGYDIEHPDLPSGPQVTGDGDLCSDGDCAWNEDGIQHGTHVAGTIAALGNNNIGVKGVVRGTSGALPLHIVRVFGRSGSTSTSNVMKAMVKCNDAGANIVSMSLGGSQYSQGYADTLETILRDNDNILFVAAAGNDGDGSKSYPASYTDVMSVASVDKQKSHSNFSQYNDAVDIAAPGTAVLSTVPNQGYGLMSGTSMATPHVAGVAALIWSYFPDAPAANIREAMEMTAEDLGTSGKDDYYGHGLVNAKAALEYLQTHIVTSPAPSMIPTVTSAPTGSCIIVEVHILPDLYANDETTWDIRAPNGDVLFKSDTNPFLNDDTLFTFKTCLPEICDGKIDGAVYIFNIYDSYGDGLNYVDNPASEGYFKVFVDGVEVRGKSDGVNFGSGDSVSTSACKSSDAPSLRPSQSPSELSSLRPSQSPSEPPSLRPSHNPSELPSQNPNPKVSRDPSQSPLRLPSQIPSQIPSQSLSQLPSESKPCVDDKNNKFVVRKKGERRKERSCHWLRKRKNRRQIRQICKKSKATKKFGAAKDVCRLTCKVCQGTSNIK